MQTTQATRPTGATARQHPLQATYWRRYFPAELVERAESLRSEVRIPSTGVEIHIDVYRRPEANAPVFLFNHGGGGYSRLFANIAVALYDRGFTVVFPDQKGQGLSGGARGDGTLSEFVQNICDAATWARAEFSGPLFVGGGSVGGALTYMASAAGAPADAFICHNLYDFGRQEDALGVSRLAFLAKLPLVPGLMRAKLGLFRRIVPGLRIPFGLLGNFRAMVDERDVGFYAIYKHDPNPMRTITLRYLAAIGSTPPAIPLEQNVRPVLVINPTRDRMTRPELTRANYERLGGPREYAELPYGHWSVSDAFVQEWTELVADYCRRMRPSSRT